MLAQASRRYKSKPARDSAVVILKSLQFLFASTDTCNNNPRFKVLYTKIQTALSPQSRVSHLILVSCTPYSILLGQVAVWLAGGLLISAPFRSMGMPAVIPFTTDPYQRLLRAISGKAEKETGRKRSCIAPGRGAGYLHRLDRRPGSSAEWLILPASLTANFITASWRYSR